MIDVSPICLSKSKATISLEDACRAAGDLPRFEKTRKYFFQGSETSDCHPGLTNGSKRKNDNAEDLT
jgi:hypothetical protein